MPKRRSEKLSNISTSWGLNIESADTLRAQNDLWCQAQDGLKRRKPKMKFDRGLVLNLAGVE